MNSPTPLSTAPRAPTSPSEKSNGHEGEVEGRGRTMIQGCLLDYLGNLPKQASKPAPILTDWASTGDCEHGSVFRDWIGPDAQRAATVRFVTRKKIRGWWIICVGPGFPEKWRGNIRRRRVADREAGMAAADAWLSEVAS